jgi:hypothetical protein
MNAERAPTEPGSINYFPQIVKYTENGPIDSMLSQDNYSNSYQPGKRQ